MDKLKKIKIKQDDGTYGPEVPIGVDAENIDMSDGKTLPEVLGPINVDANGTIKHQFDELNKNKVDKDVYDNFKEEINKKIDKTLDYSSDYKWIKRGYMREQVREFQGWAHCIKFDSELGKAVGLVLSGVGSHSNTSPYYRVEIDPTTGYMSDYVEIIVNYPENSEHTDCGYIGSFVIKKDGTYWMCDYYKRIFISKDKGYTWTFSNNITLGRDSFNNDFLFGAIELTNGRMVAGNGGQPAAETYYSDDGGLNWNVISMDVSNLGKQSYPEGRYVPFEPCFIECGNNIIIQYARASMNAYNTYGEGLYSKKEPAVYAISKDNGNTWHPYKWSNSIIDMTANNGSCIIIKDKIHFVFGSRYKAEDNNFHLFYSTTSLVDILDDKWTSPFIIENGHWDIEIATNPHDCGYPSLFKDNNNNLFSIYYDSDGNKTPYGANWRLCIGTQSTAQIISSSNEGKGSMTVGYTQIATENLLQKQKQSLMELISDLYSKIGEIPPDSGDLDGSMYLTDSLVDFWQPQKEENWEVGSSYYTLKGMYEKADVISVSRTSQYTIPNITPSSFGLYQGHAFCLKEKYSNYCKDEFSFEGIFYTSDNSDGFLKIFKNINNYSTDYYANILQAKGKWNDLTIGKPFGSQYPLSKKISHIVICVKNKEMKIYVNGICQTTFSNESLSSILDGYLGIAGFNDQIADIRLYSKFLSEEEIKNNYKYEKNIFEI